MRLSLALGPILEVATLAALGAVSPASAGDARVRLDISELSSLATSSAVNIAIDCEARRMQDTKLYAVPSPPLTRPANQIRIRLGIDVPVHNQYCTGIRVEDARSAAGMVAVPMRHDDRVDGADAEMP